MVRRFPTFQYPEQGSNLQTLGPCVELLLGRVALPVGVPGRFEEVVLDGIEPSFPACKTGVVAVGPQDFGSLKFEGGSLNQNAVTFRYEK